MIPYDDFKENYYSHKKTWRNFSENEILGIHNGLPKEIAEFLEIEGVSSYANDFLWTTLPQEFYEILSAWGLKGKDCHTIMRTAFGACIFYKRNEFFYLDPIMGRVVRLASNLYMLLNYSLLFSEILDYAFFEKQYNNINKSDGLLSPDEIYSLVPAMPIGGSFDASSFEITKMREHLFFLAQLFGGKAKTIR